MALIGIAILSLLIWIFLLGFWGQFWRTNQRLEETLKLKARTSQDYPCVWVVIPARNEAKMLPKSLPSLVNQDYPGNFQIILVDDQSEDGTAQIAQAIDSKINVIPGKPLPSGWTGKLWALEQGINYGKNQTPAPDFFLLTDADIVHDPGNVQQLVAKAEQENLQLVSLMVRLRCETFWEKSLIPAFVFFFQKLYPFAWVNNPQKKVAAAAGGCILIRPQALERIGGVEVLREALIDDCTLAQAVKLSPLGESRDNYPIWLGLTEFNFSLRPYDSLASIWDMVARTAFTQLNYSTLLLVGALLGMTIVYLIPIVAICISIFTANWAAGILGICTWLLMAYAYLPTVRFYRLAPSWAICLPAIAFLYTLMTLDSAVRHWRGRGGAWKGRVYSQ